MGSGGKGRQNAWLLVLLAVAVVGLFAVRGLDLPQVVAPWLPLRGPKPQRPPLPGPGTELLGIRAAGRERGRRTWELRADRLNRTVDGLVIEAYNIHDGKIYEESGASWSFRAGYARYELLTGRLRIWGGISGVLGDGTTFAAERAEADTRRRTIEIPVPVTVRGKDLNLSADSLTADLAAETVTLRGNVALEWPEGRMRAAEAVYSFRDGTFAITGQAGEGVDLSL